MVGLLGRGISLSQGHYLHTETRTHTDIHAPIRILTHEPSVWAREDGSCLRLRGHCDHHILKRKLLVILECIIAPLYSETQTIKTYIVRKTTMQIDLYDCEPWRRYFSEGCTYTLQVSADEVLGKTLQKLSDAYRSPSGVVAVISRGLRLDVLLD
jgi:hypothetical protein